jgi:hypothetical protein
MDPLSSPGSWATPLSTRDVDDTASPTITACDRPDKNSAHQRNVIQMYYCIFCLIIISLIINNNNNNNNNLSQIPTFSCLNNNLVWTTESNALLTLQHQH